MTADLARFVALPLRGLDEYPAGTCVAWMEGPAKVCGKAADFYLCPRHIKVAQRKQAAEAERIERRDQRATARAEAARPRREAELAKIENRIRTLDPQRAPGGLDHGVLNTNLRTRMPSPERIHELAVLHARRKDLRRQLGME